MVLVGAQRLQLVLAIRKDEMSYRGKSTYITGDNCFLSLVIACDDLNVGRREALLISDVWFSIALKIIGVNL